VFPWGHWDSALFESVSGFTTTGSTVLADIEARGDAAGAKAAYEQYLDKAPKKAPLRADVESRLG